MEEVYPLDGSGFVAATCPLEVANQSSTVGSFVARMFVPAGTRIDGLAVHVSGTSAAAAGGLNSYALYDDTGKLVTQSVSDNALWSTGGWAFRDLQTPVPAQAVDRYVYVGVTCTGMASQPSILYNVPGRDVFNFTKAIGKVRAVYTSNLGVAWPATTDFASGTWTTTNYLPVIVAYGASGEKGSESLLLNVGDPVPADTPVDTLIFRKG